MVVRAGGGQRAMIRVGLRDEDFGQSVERDLLWDLLLLGLCFVLGFPQLFAEGLVQGFGFLLQRYTLPKTMFLSFLGLKWWETIVAPRE